MIKATLTNNQYSIICELHDDKNNFVIRVGGDRLDLKTMENNQTFITVHKGKGLTDSLVAMIAVDVVNDLRDNTVDKVSSELAGIIDGLDLKLGVI